MNKNETRKHGIRVDRLLQMVRERGLFPLIERHAMNISQASYETAFLEVARLLLPHGFTIDEHNRSAIFYLLQWLEGSPNAQQQDPESGVQCPANLSKGFYVCGPTGTGKTLVMNILSELCANLGITYRMGEQRFPLSWQSIRASTICMQYVREGRLDAFIEPRVLCIQDLGSEPREVLYMGNRVELLRTIIEERGDRHDCITHFTSNYRLAGQQLLQCYGIRAVSRLFEMCNYVEMKGDDRRKRGREK
ncbi:hypothetical protein [Porphyromonas circumdentaria]|uniref:hypothetical protein n=1 Tax=Porphyromonas circumdentaria TaxID=29524 RepID=UPI0026DBA6AC|nr:hypothetical protein [Porphyromonas circumdentaria]MDO4722926.1 hypothetical protein [Porphyromonas circumdentaria]